MSVGTDIFVGDLLDFRSVQRTSTRLFTICFACPVQEGPLEATANRAVAAREADVQLASATVSPVRVPAATDTFERLIRANPLTPEDFVTKKRTDHDPARDFVQL